MLIFLGYDPETMTFYDHYYNWRIHVEEGQIKLSMLRTISDCTENEAKSWAAMRVVWMNLALFTKILHTYLLFNIWSWYIHEIKTHIYTTKITESVRM